MLQPLVQEKKSGAFERHSFKGIPAGEWLTNYYGNLLRHDRTEAACLRDPDLRTVAMSPVNIVLQGSSSDLMVNLMVAVPALRRVELAVDALSLRRFDREVPVRSVRT